MVVIVLVVTTVSVIVGAYASLPSTACEVCLPSMGCVKSSMTGVSTAEAVPPGVGGALLPGSRGEVQDEVQILLCCPEVK